MSLSSLIFALLLEQLYPLSSHRYLQEWLLGYAGFFRNRFNAGERRQGTIAWMLAVLPITIAAIGMFRMLGHGLHPAFAWAFDVMVLYLTMGFRKFSHYFTDIQHALQHDRLEEARGLLVRWSGIEAHQLNEEAVARISIEQALIATQRNVFGILFWFMLFGVLGLGGAGGALLYCISQYLRGNWSGEEQGMPEFGRFARQAFHILEWLPVRFTAMTFAIVGNFEDTVYCWRTQANGWDDPDTGILLASGAGALGVRLGMPIQQGGMPVDRPELGTGEEAGADFMQSAIGLVWRSVVFWTLLLLLLTLANWLG